MKRLNLGCGKDYLNGWVNVDVINVKKDVKHDINKFPYPFKASTFDEVLMKMILEHVENPIKVLKEVVRISKNGAKITITVPHATSYANYTDLQHKTNFTENSFGEGLLEEYELKEMVLKNREFILVNKWKKFIPFKNILKIFINGVHDSIKFEFEIKK
jgi:ubiquinone/menaquinone biosynthesis C-methylase UbiE